MIPLLYLPLTLSQTHSLSNTPTDLRKVKLRCSDAIFECKQTTLLHFTGLLMVFKRISDTSKVMKSVTVAHFLESNIYKMNVSRYKINRSNSSTVLLRHLMQLFNTNYGTVAPRLFQTRSYRPSADSDFVYQYLSLYEYFWLCFLPPYMNTSDCVFLLYEYDCNFFLLRWPLWILLIELFCYRGR